MTAASVTPRDLTITPRDRRFGREAGAPRLWHGGKVEATAIYNALSWVFPKGEAFFVESVRACSAGAPPKLAAEIKAFTTQEVIHSREHLAFNRRAMDSGYDMTKLDERLDYRLAILRSKPPAVQLAATMALEHFTAILAHALLADPRHLEGAETATADLWRWHAIEEIEHKGVAYDSWLHATRSWTRWKRWNVKARVMLLVSQNFVIDRSLGAIELMRQDGVTGWRAWAKLQYYLWGSPGMFRKIAGAWLRYFLPGFHPWNEDDRHLIAAYEAKAPIAPEPKRKVRRAV